LREVYDNSFVTTSPVQKTVIPGPNRNFHLLAMGKIDTSQNILFALALRNDRRVFVSIRIQREQPARLVISRITRNYQTPIKRSLQLVDRILVDC